MRKSEVWCRRSVGREGKKWREKEVCGDAFRIEGRLRRGRKGLEKEGMRKETGKSGGRKGEEKG